MMTSYRKLLYACILTLHISAAAIARAQSAADTVSSAKIEKKAFIPGSVWRVPEGNDYNDPTSEYSNSRKIESENIVLFWAKAYGDRPMDNPDTTQRFDPQEIIKACEDMYRFYTTELKFVEVGHSLSDRYKLLMYVFSGDDGTAYGGGAEEQIGVLWTPAVRIHKAPYGALAHEMGHSFQYLAKCDGNWAYSTPPSGSRGQSIFEMTSQYMLWQVYPHWITFENYHLKGFMDKTHYAFLHETNQYHSPFVLEYWSSKHGIDFIGKMWRAAQKGEDAVLTYKRLNGMTQEAFNDELFEGYCRFVTWDMPRIEPYAAAYANQHRTSLLAEGQGSWLVAPGNAPQDYGYNAIRLQLPAANTSEVELSFEGLSDLAGYRTFGPQRAGWRYGFLAVSKSGKRTYGKMNDQAKGRSSFKVPADTEYLWLVVMGAPATHAIHLVDGKDETDEQWPYRLKLSGTAPFAE